MSEVQRPANAVDAFDSTTPSPAIEQTTHRYEGSPKSND
jgi:hypothetical protein